MIRSGILVPAARNVSPITYKKHKKRGKKGNSFQISSLLKGSYSDSSIFSWHKMWPSTTKWSHLREPLLHSILMTFLPNLREGGGTTSQLGEHLLVSCFLGMFFKTISSGSFLAVIIDHLHWSTHFCCQMISRPDDASWKGCKILLYSLLALNQVSPDD